MLPACPAVTLAIATGPRVLLVKWMPTVAMGLSRLPTAESITRAVVSSMIANSKMTRIDAMTDAAEVINDHAVGYSSTQ
jgi:ABC-type uncharacterized transport system YnjBCD permease subunit